MREGTSVSTTVAVSEAVDLLHVLVNRVAERSDIRVLFIKGPILAQQGLRPERPSIDVDVLVDPARFEDAQEVLRDLGWRVLSAAKATRFMDLHSKTYRHDSWPCDIDVHYRFPGFLAAPQDVFEVLWERRTSASIAGHEIPCPDVLGNVAVSALHALRSPSFDRSQKDLAFMTETLRQRLDDEGLRELAALGLTTGSSDTLRPLLDAIGAPRLNPEVPPSRELKAWQLRTRSGGVKTAAWLYHLRSAPLHGRLPLLWYVLFRTEAELRAAHPDAAPGAWGLFKVRARRLAGAVKDLPRAVRIVRDRRPRKPNRLETVDA